MFNYGSAIEYPRAGLNTKVLIRRWSADKSAMVWKNETFVGFYLFEEDRRKLQYRRPKQRVGCWATSRTIQNLEHVILSVFRAESKILLPLLGEVSAWVAQEEERRLRKSQRGASSASPGSISDVQKATAQYLQHLESVHERLLSCVEQSAFIPSEEVA